MKGIMPDFLQESLTDFDVYYENHLLVITNENHGGTYRTEFPLNPDTAFTPYIAKVNYSRYDLDTITF